MVIMFKEIKDNYEYVMYGIWDYKKWYSRYKKELNLFLELNS